MGTSRGKRFDQVKMPDEVRRLRAAVAVHDDHGPERLIPFLWLEVHVEQRAQQGGCHPSGCDCRLLSVSRSVGRSMRSVEQVG